VGGAGESADLQEGVGVALGAGAWVGDVFGGGAGCGELLYQGAERGTVFGFEESFEAEPSVAACPEPEFSRSGGGLGLLAWWGTVGVEVREDVSSDLVQRCGVE
jgi:hypothetical protein